MMFDVRSYHMGCTDGNSISNSLWGIHIRIVFTEKAAVNCFHRSYNSWILQYAIRYAKIQCKLYVTHDYITQ